MHDALSCATARFVIYLLYVSFSSCILLSFAAVVSMADSRHANMIKQFKLLLKTDDDGVKALYVRIQTKNRDDEQRQNIMHFSANDKCTTDNAIV